MRVIVTGDREWHDILSIYTRLEQLPSDSIIVHGDCRGADKIADICAKELGLPREPYPANWRQYRSGAGSIRNQYMLDVHPVDLVIGFHNQFKLSKGTRDMLTRTKKAGIAFELHNALGKIPLDKIEW